MTKEEIFERVKKVFKDIFRSDVITLETKKEDVPNWDSITHVMFLSAIQKEFKIAFCMNDLVSLDSVDKIVNCIMKSI